MTQLAELLILSCILASQGSLAYEREKDRLIAVNAGSNTITVRAVNGYRLLRRQVLPTLGSFRSPWRPHGDVVCVLNTRDGGSIQGYRRIGSLLAPIRRGTARWASSPTRRRALLGWVRWPRPRPS